MDFAYTAAGSLRAHHIIYGGQEGNFQDANAVRNLFLHLTTSFRRGDGSG